MGKKSSLKPTAGSSEVSPVRRSPRLKEKQENETFSNSNCDSEGFRYTKGGTAIVYDPVMLLHKCLWSPHVECPERLEGAISRLRSTGLLEKCIALSPMVDVKKQILICHDENYVQDVDRTSEMANDVIEKFSNRFDSVYFCQDTKRASYTAVGCALELVDAVCSDRVRNGFALIRPPGHHAMPNESCGFSVFNNCAIAARYCLEKFNLQRILIVDFDVHHGQATQMEFYDDPRVLYFSIHRFEHGSFWPSLEISDFHYTGSSKAPGFNVNVPLNKTGLGDSDYLAVFYQLLLPIAYEFNPELILVSAGFDCSVGDPKGHMQVSPAAFGHMVYLLRGIAHERLALLLEGGYNIDVVPLCVESCVRALLGEPCTALANITKPDESVIESILNSITYLRPYWNCFQVQVGENSPRKWPNHIPVVKYERPSAIEESLAEMKIEKKEENFPSVSQPMGIENSIGIGNSMGTGNSMGIGNLGFLKNFQTPAHRTLLAFDLNMTKHRPLNTVDHPERPERITAILEEMRPFFSKCLIKDGARSATKEELLLCHLESYLDLLEDMPSMKKNDLISFQNRFNSIYCCSDSLNAAKLAVGCLLDATDEVLNGNIQNACVVIRPPGHHAVADEAYGFCFFNNVAVAAEHAKVNHGLKRILILDWDVHHGNGIQDIFYSDPNIFYISLHRYDDGFFFPVNSDSHLKFSGDGKGKGFNCNIPWSGHGLQMGDSEYLSAFFSVVMPMALEFNPEIVFVSAGFDGARGDPLGGYDITPAGFAQMCHFLCSLGNGKVILALEGGYNLTSISKSMTACLRVLLGEAPPPIHLKPANKFAIETIRDVLETMAPFWRSLCYNVSLPKRGNFEQNEKLSLKQIRSDQPDKTDSLPKRGNFEQNEKLSLKQIRSDQTESTNEGRAQAEGGGADGQNQIPMIQIRENALKAAPIGSSLNFPRTAIIYDPLMLRHRNEYEPTHIEKPERLSVTWDRLESHGLIKRCLRLESRRASKSELMMVHEEKYIELISSTSQMKIEEIEKNVCSQFDDIYMNEATYDCALLAAGCVLEAVDAIFRGDCENAMALVRPPGHHAYPGANGFCIFNNIAIAAKQAKKLGASRILIADYDVHPGQGTQFAFADDPSVLVVSIHRYEEGNFWPNLSETNYDYLGVGEGKGYSVNVPLNKIGLGNSDYLTIFHHVVLPIALEFQPDLVLVSMGIDAASHDPEGRMCLEPAVYAAFTKELLGFAGGKLLAVFEGGYCIESVAESVSCVLETLLGDPIPPVVNFDPIDPAVWDAIFNVTNVLRPFWDSMAVAWDSLQNEARLMGKNFTVFDRPCVGKPRFSGPPYPTRGSYSFNFPIDVGAAEVRQVVNQYKWRKCGEKSLVFSHSAMRIHHFDRNRDAFEHPERIAAILRHFQFTKLTSLVPIRDGRAATVEELQLVHTSAHIDTVKSYTNDYLNDEAEKFPSYTCEDTYEAATFSVGCCLEAVDAVLDNKCNTAFAVVRPPSHHASASQAAGYCYFNGTAIAAKHAQRRGCGKILIVDWDVHFGNGTADIFSRDKSVLYISLHRHDSAEYYPKSVEGDIANVGLPPAEGFNVNIAWNKGNKNDSDYLFAFNKLVLPLANEFRPDFVIVSAGFDAAAEDPLGECNLSPSTYAYMTHMLQTLANGRLVLLLEGGYNINALKNCSTACALALAGISPNQVPKFVEVQSDTIEIVAKVVNQHRKYWDCFRYAHLPNFAAESRGKAQQQSAGSSAAAANPQSTNNSAEANRGSTNNSTAAANRGSTNTVAEFLGFRPDEIPEQMMFAVVPLPECPHLDAVREVPAGGLNANDPCLRCGNSSENWVCLTCYQVHCGRYVQEHGIDHWNTNRSHAMVLSYADLSIWCYECEAYVHNEILLPVKSAGHQSKFGTHLPHGSL